MRADTTVKLESHLDRAADQLKCRLELFTPTDGIRFLRWRRPDVRWTRPNNPVEYSIVSASCDAEGSMSALNILLCARHAALCEAYNLLD